MSPPPEMTDQGDTGCRNCGSAAVGSFCPDCGQKQVADDRSLLPWLRGVLDELLSLDGRMIRTLRALFFSPGTLTVAWIEGERARYTPPVRLYLVSSLLFFGALSILGTDPFPTNIVIQGPAQRQTAAIFEADPEASAILTAAAAAYREVIEDAVTMGLIVVVPATALILQLLLLRSRSWYYVDHLIHALHVISAVLLVWAAAWPLFFLDLPGPPMWLALAIWGLLLAYGAVSFWRVYRLGVLKSAVAYPGMLVLGFAGGTMVFTNTFGDKLVVRLGASVQLWEDAYRSYAERIYRRVTDAGPSEEDRREDLDRSPLLYLHAPPSVRHMDAHFVTDIADLHLLRGEPQEALRILGRATGTVRETPDAVGAQAVAYHEVGDTGRARDLALSYLDMNERGVRGMHAERANRYRLAALRIAGG